MESAIQPNQGFSQAKQAWLRNAGIFSLFLYAFFWLLDLNISRIGESLMLLFFLVMLFTNKPKFLLKEPILYMLIAWVTFQVGVYQWSSSMFPELAGEHITEARHLTKIFLFVVVAWWLGGSTKRVTTFFTLCAAGFIIGATLQDGGLLDAISRFLRSARLNYGYMNAQHTAVYSSFVLLGLVSLQRKIISCTTQKYKGLVKVSIYIAITYSFIVIITTQARAAWLGLTITGFIFFIIWFINHIKKENTKPLRFDIRNMGVTTVAGIIAITISTAAVIYYDTSITKRLTAERVTLEKLTEGDFEHIKKGSIGIRIDSWRMALGWIKERPITGWGAQTRKALIQRSDWPIEYKKKFGHLHNSYLELLVDYGVVGLSLFAGLFAYIWFRAWQAWRHNIIPNDIMAFGALWCIYWLIVNCFESYIIYSATGNYLNAIVMGVLYTYHLSRVQNTMTAANKSN